MIDKTCRAVEPRSLRPPGYVVRINLGQEGGDKDKPRLEWCSLWRLFKDFSSVTFVIVVGNYLTCNYSWKKTSVKRAFL